MKKTYLKKSHIYWTAKKLNKHSLNVWYFIANIIIWTIFYSLLFKLGEQYNSGKLISPLTGIKVTQVYASEPVIIKCELGPKEYLSCKAYNGEITWEEHDRIAKVINCESRWNPEAINVNKNGTIDTGIVQRNSIHNKTLSTKDSFDYKKSIDWMINKMHKDGGLNAWVCNRLVK